MVYEEEQAKRRPRVSVRVHGERPLVFTFFIYPHDASTEDKTAGNTTPHRTARRKNVRWYRRVPDQSTQQGIAFQPGPINVSEGSVGEVGGRKARHKKDKAWNIATFKIFVSSCGGGRKPQKQTQTNTKNQHTTAGERGGEVIRKGKEAGKRKRN